MTPDARDATVHATAPQTHSEAGSVWPAVLALAIVLGAVGLTVSPLLAGAAGVLALIGVGGVTREVARAHGAARAPHVALALALGLPVLLVLVSVLRAFVSHGLLDPQAWPEVARDLNTPLAIASTLLFLASAGTAAWALRGGGPRALVATLGAGVAALAARAGEWARLVAAGFTHTSGTAGSAYYALTGFHALAALGGLAMIGIALWRARRDTHGDAAARGGVTAGAATFWLLVVGTWLLAYAVAYLRLVQVETKPLE